MSTLPKTIWFDLLWRHDKTKQNMITAGILISSIHPSMMNHVIVAVIVCHIAIVIVMLNATCLIDGCDTIVAVNVIQSIVSNSLYSHFSGYSMSVAAIAKHQQRLV